MTKKEVVVFNFDNVKQAEFYDKVMLAVARQNMLRYFFYGGAIRGGKTFICLYIIWVLANTYPRSRWHIFRADFPELEDTTIPSMEKLVGVDSKFFVWKRKQSNYHILLANGSKIFFKSEKADKDPELNWLLGLETNGVLLEQMEGLTEKLLSRAIERVGSWYIPNMPPPIVMGTFNPTDKWVKKKIYDPYREGKLPEDYLFQEALPQDNPLITADQWKNWENLDPVTRNQLIKGIWKFENDSKLFAYSFHGPKHIVDMNTPEGRAKMTPQRNMPVYVIFDFNVDPITALICQHEKMNWAKVLAEYRLRTSDIFELTERIRNDWGDYYLVVTGDASGRARSALTKGNRSYVQTIQTELRLKTRQMAFPTKNPSIANTRIVMNSLFHNHKAIWIASTCLFLIDDLESVKVNHEGDIDKKKNALKTHLLDNLRYYFWNYFKGFVRL